MANRFSWLPGIVSEHRHVTAGMSRTDAKQRADYIRRTLTRIGTDIEVVAARIIVAWRNKDWETLGYASWAEYCQIELGSDMAMVHATVRKLWEPSFREAGMSTVDIAAVCGCDRKTVQRDEHPDRTNVRLAAAETTGTNATFVAPAKDEEPGQEAHQQPSGSPEQPRESSRQSDSPGRSESVPDMASIHLEYKLTGQAPTADELAEQIVLTCNREYVKRLVACLSKILDA
jgi:hypothetical protein